VSQPGVDIVRSIEAEDELTRTRGSEQIIEDCVDVDRKEDDERRPLTIDIFFDFICPWCLIGKRNLETALRRFTELRPDVCPKVQWHAYELLPGTPEGGIPYQAFYLARLGSPEALAMRRAQVQAAGHAAGIKFAFERIEVLPNTALAHDLVAYAAAQGMESRREALVERLFTAYFIEGEDIGNRQVLERIRRECGLNHQALLEHLVDSHPRSGLTSRRSRHDEHVVSGVPSFVFNGTHALSGAHSPYALLQAMLQSSSA